MWERKLVSRSPVPPKTQHHTFIRHHYTGNTADVALVQFRSNACWLCSLSWVNSHRLCVQPRMQQNARQFYPGTDEFGWFSMKEWALFVLSCKTSNLLMSGSEVPIWLVCCCSQVNYDLVLHVFFFLFVSLFLCFISHFAYFSCFHTQLSVLLDLLWIDVTTLAFGKIRRLESFLRWTG